jgi:hypothetical protein
LADIGENRRWAIFIGKLGIDNSISPKKRRACLLFDKTLDHLFRLYELLRVVDMADVAAAVLQNA